MATVTMERSLRQTVLDHLNITKPRIIVLIALTTWAAMWIAAPERPEGPLVFFTLLGTALAVGSAHTFNAYIERDIDAMMRRTEKRPLPTGRMDPVHARRYAYTLGILSFVVMAWQVNLLSAALAQAGLLFYVLIYTVWLKPRTPLNTVIGGISGAIPPLIGWAAVNNRLEAAALLLFALMVLWQPPHFFALTLYRLEDYRRAQVPMLPVVSGVEVTLRQIAQYTVAMVVLSLGLYFPLGVVGEAYLVTALVFGGAYIGLTWASVRRREGSVEQWGKRLFLYSMLYLTVLFAAMVLDVKW